MNLGPYELGPDYESETNGVYCGDALALMQRIPSESVDLIFVDPPYNIGVFCKMPAADYLAWCAEWIAECDRVLKPNGAFWVSHKDPAVLVDISREIERLGRKRINWVTWDKMNGNPAHQACGGPIVGMTQVESLRSFQVMAEYLIYHADEGDWTAQCDRQRGFIFEPLRTYLASEWARAGLTSRDANIATNTQMAGHYLTQIQWALPTEERYNQLRAYANNGHTEYLRREYEDLRREYEDLRREYEDLRYTFNNPGKVSSVWQIPPAAKNGHPTPKPPELLERIILATSNEGDIVLDPMCGSGTMCKSAGDLGRYWLAFDNQAKYAEASRARVAAQPQQTEMRLAA